MKDRIGKVSVKQWQTRAGIDALSLLSHELACGVQKKVRTVRPYFGASLSWVPAEPTSCRHFEPVRLWQGASKALLGAAFGNGLKKP